VHHKMWTLTQRKKNGLYGAYPPGEWSWRISGSKKQSTFPRKNWVPEWCNFKKIMNTVYMYMYNSQ